MQKQKKVYFNLRKSSRERMWDTAREAERVCVPILPQVKQQTSLARSQSYKNIGTKYLRKLKHTLKETLPILNYQTVGKESEQADILYMWGAFPKNSKKPFIIELDNPFVLTYYNQLAFKLRLGSIKRKLRQAKCVTFMSETARNHCLELFGQEFSEKFMVLPPYMDSNYQKSKAKDPEMTKFLFVGLGFRRKGGPELLKAFSEIENANISLTVVSPVSEEIIKKYVSDTRITFTKPQPRQILFEDFYPTHDIFIFPSLLETLGVVILEALSFGMGIITTDVYATPEMVKDGYNGKILKHPFLTHTNLNGQEVIDAVSIPRTNFSERYLQSVDCYEGLVLEIKEAIELAVKDKTNWQNSSVVNFSKNYSSDIWESSLIKVLY